MFANFRCSFYSEKRWPHCAESPYNNKLILFAILEMKIKIGNLHKLYADSNGCLTLIERKALNSYIFFTLFFAIFMFKSWLPIWLGVLAIIFTWIFSLPKFKITIDNKNNLILKCLILFNIEVYRYFKVTNLSNERIVCSKKSAPGDDVSIGPTFYFIELFSDNLNNHLLITKFSSIEHVDIFRNFILEYTEFDFKMH